MQYFSNIKQNKIIKMKNNEIIYIKFNKFVYKNNII